MILKGQNLRVFMAGAAITEATSCQISMTGNTDDSSTKDTTSDFSVNTVVSRSWQVTVDHIDASPATLKALITAIIAKAPVTLKWDQTSGAQNRTAAGAVFARTGQALITDLTITAPNRQKCTVSIQFQGKGAPSNVV